MYPHSLLTVAREARHSHPSPPEEKAASRKKVGFAEKKLRLWQKMAHRVYQGWHIPTYDSCLNRPSEAHRFGCG
ncbi:MAG: hypothetical protein PUE25_02370, partial [bacterium]|nr:hypothetical protein [bacterium]